MLELTVMFRDIYGANLLDVYISYLLGFQRFTNNSRDYKGKSLHSKLPDPINTQDIISSFGIEKQLCYLYYCLFISKWNRLFRKNDTHSRNLVDHLSNKIYNTRLERLRKSKFQINYST